MKRTILSGKELKLLENAISSYGVIVSFDQIREISSDKNRQSVRNFVSKLSKKGWLVRIKRGLYFVAGVESLGFSGLSVYKKAQLFCFESYVSFEAALQYHGMFDQGLELVTSISTKSYSLKNIENVKFKFVKVRRNLFYGYKKYRVENYLVNIAFPEKAILDILCFKRSLYSVDLVLEKLINYRNDFDLNRLKEYIQKQPVSVKRITGFLLDKAGIKSEFIYDSIKDKRNCNFMVKKAKKFNAKWRLYYDEYFDKD